MSANLMYEVVEIVNSWTPRWRRGWPERKYRDVLLSLLKREGAGEVEKSKWLTDRVRRPDIQVSNLDNFAEINASSEIVYVELKLDLKSKAEHERLVSQIVDILERPEPPTRGLIVGLIGETDPIILSQLQAREGSHERLRVINGGRKLSRRLRVLPIPFHS